MKLSGRFIIIIAVLAVILRLVSFHYNHYLNGDVNLFVAVAQNYASYGNYALPFHYNLLESDTKDPVAGIYQEHYTQHQPLWIITSALAGRAFPHLDMFFIMKCLSFVCGLMLLFLFTRNSRQDRNILPAFILMSFSISLIDYSANGSFYILLALLYTCVILVLQRSESPGKTMLLAVLIFAAIMTHYISIALVGAIMLMLFFGKNTVKEKYSYCLVIAAVLVLTAISVIMAKNGNKNAGINPSLVNFLVSNGLAEYTFDPSSGSPVLKNITGIGTIGVIARNIIATTRYFAVTLFFVTTFLLPFFIYGLYTIIKNRDLKLNRAVLAVLLAHVLIIYAFPYTRYRFIIPVVPVIYYITAAGIERFTSGGALRLKSFRVDPAKISAVFVVLFIISALFNLYRYPHIYYSKSNPGFASTYDTMMETVKYFSNNPCGKIMGYSQLLDGGIETVYYHKCSFINGRGFLNSPEAAEQAVRKFGVTHVWTDEMQYAANPFLLKSRVVRQNRPFMILEVEPGR